MRCADALSELGVGPGDDLPAVRRAYHRLLRERHPDLVAGHVPDDDATRHTTRLIEAYEIVVELLASSSDGRIPVEPDSADAAREPTATTPVHADALDEDALLVDAPPDLAWVLLVDAAARVGSTAYVDPSLGLLEIMVRFEGGPTCSVVFTLQGRGQHTEIMCSMASIESAPTPPIAPVVDALVEALLALG